MGASPRRNHLKEKTVLEIPRSGLKALLHNQDAEFENATLPVGCESTQGPSPQPCER